MDGRALLMLRRLFIFMDEWLYYLTLLYLYFYAGDVLIFTIVLWVGGFMVLLSYYYYWRVTEREYALLQTPPQYNAL